MKQQAVAMRGAAWIKTLVGCDKWHIPSLFIISLDTGCAGPVSLVLGLGTAVTWPPSVCPALNLKADLLV